MSRIALGAPSTQWYEQGHTEPNHPVAWELKEERKHKERTVVAKKKCFLAELGQARQKNFWLEVMMHRPNPESTPNHLKS